MLEGLHIYNPQWLWCLAAVPVIWAVGGASTSVPGRYARMATAALRSAAWVLIVLALARPIQTDVSTPTTRRPVVILSDRSLSIGQDPASSQSEAEFASSLRSLGSLQRIEFASQVWAAGEEPPRLEGTDIEAALTRAEAGFGADPGIVLLMSDGRATTGDAVRAATRMRAQGHTVHVLATGLQRESGPRIVGVHPPSNPRLGQPAAFFVHVRTDRDHNCELRLLDGEGTEVDRVPVPTNPEAVVAMRCVPTQAGFQNYKVLIAGDSADATVGHQTIAGAPIFVEGPPRVLIIDTIPDETAQLAAALRNSGLRVEHVALNVANYSYDQLVQYDLVILSDCASMEDNLQSDLVRYVEDSAGGVLFIGGRNVRTSEWHGSIVERALPVEFLPEAVRAVQKPRPVHVCFVLDKSGSMGSPLGATGLGLVSKLDMVKAAVQQSVAELPPEATVSVVAFDSTTTVLADAVPAGRWNDASAFVDRLPADGGTLMDPAIEAGLDLLSKDEQRYLIVLTDGQTAVPTANPQRRWDDLIAKMQALDVSLTTIALGADADHDLLAYLAAGAGGISYECANASEVPTIFVREAQLIKQTSRAKEAPFRPRAGDAMLMLRGLRTASFPRLADGLAVKAKPLIQTVLTGRGKPLLALRKQGLGTVIVFASDAKTVWARDWLAWSSFQRFWTQVASWALRPANRISADVSVSVHGTSVKVLVSATDEDGNPVEHLQGTGTLRAAAPLGGISKASLQWRGIRPGVYQADCDLPGMGNHLCYLQFANRSTTVFTQSLLVSTGTTVEMASTGPDMDSLRSIAEAGGGLLNPTPAQILQAARQAQQRTQQSAHTREWWPWLVMVSIFLWMADVSLRRLVVVRAAHSTSRANAA